MDWLMDSSLYVCELYWLMKKIPSRPVPKFQADSTEAKRDKRNKLINTDEKPLTYLW